MNPFAQALITLVFAISLAGAGAFIIDRFLPQAKNFPLALALSFAVGHVAVSYTVTGLAALGFLGAPPLYAVFAVCFALATIFIAQNIKSLSFSKPSSSTVIFGLLLAGFCVPAALIALAPPYMRDALVYHLTLPKAYLAAEGLTDIPGNFYSAFPKGQEMIFAMLMGVAGDRAAQMFGVICQAFCGIGIFGLVAGKYGKAAGAICAFGFVAAPAGAYFAGGSYVEPAICLAIVSTIAALCLFEEHRSIGWAALAGLFAGFTLALKFTGLLYLGAFALLLLYLMRKSSAGQVVKISAAFAAACLPGFFFLIRNAIVHNNPVFPFAYSIFGGRGWDAQRALAYSIHMNDFGMGRSIIDYILLPFRISFTGVFDSPLFDGLVGAVGILFLVLCAITVVVLQKGARPAVSGLGAVLLASLAFFAFGTQQSRFFLPSQAIAVIYAAPAVYLVLDRAKSNERLKLLVYTLIAFAVAHCAFELGMVCKKDGFWRPVLGVSSESGFLRNRLSDYTAVEAINEKTPPDSKLLCAMTGNRAYYLDRKYRADTFIENHTLEKMLAESPSADKFVANFKSEGFTHLFAHLPLVKKSLDKKLFRILSLAIRNYGAVVYQSNSYFVIEISDGR